MDNNSLTNRIVNTLSYISILFLPVIFPLIVWIVAGPDHPNIKHHAKQAFWSQIFPLIYSLLGTRPFHTSAH